MNTVRIYVSGPTHELPDRARARGRRPRPRGAEPGRVVALHVRPRDPGRLRRAAERLACRSVPRDGEMAGQPLVSGTYTVGMEGYKIYSIDGTDYRDTANATFDFLLGTATVLEPREVVKIENCRRCHVDLRAHGGIRREVKLCVLCHVSGSEDRNEPTVLNGSPGRLGRLPRDDPQDPQRRAPAVRERRRHEHGRDAELPRDAGPLRARRATRTRSTTSRTSPFPVWPNLTFPMPRDEGYTALTSAAKAQEDAIRTRRRRAATSATAILTGAGPLTAPAQGGTRTRQPDPPRLRLVSRRHRLDPAVPLEPPRDAAAVGRHSPAASATARRARSLRTTRTCTRSTIRRSTPGSTSTS